MQFRKPIEITLYEQASEGTPGAKPPALQACVHFWILTVGVLLAADILLWGATR